MKTFAELELIAPLQRALAEENYVTPTPIQAQTVPPAIAGRDILGSAQTGTGKTAAFALPILNRLGKQNRKAVPNRPNALILAPTRELAIQIGESFATYGRHLRLRQALVYGGVGQGNQVRMLSRGAHILVATPGRLLDLMNQGHIQLDQLEVFVLDEADRMLDMGFLPDLKRIIKQLPQNRQSLFFSATLPPKITELSESLLQDPVTVNVTPETRSVDLIDQRVVFVERGAKQGYLRDLLTGEGVDRAVVFTRTKRGANTLAEQLERSGFRATAIHGNKSQGARQKALDAFRRKHVQVLVATDVAARGIDVDGVTHVVNFDIPDEPESYVHRIGRTGRAGASGMAVSFCSSSERRELRAIEQLIGQKIPLAANQPEPPPREEHPASKSYGHKAAASNRRPGPRGRSPYSGGGKPSGPRSGSGHSNGSGSGNGKPAAGSTASAGRPSRPKAKRRPKGMAPRQRAAKQD
ncbi:MAG: DEAD/DEAH box helicase [Planctomycetaceae bacterium]|nr:DEAD/DEAH box helicase [Planctomycetaceae bacterium]